MFALYTSLVYPTPLALGFVKCINPVSADVADSERMLAQRWITKSYAETTTGRCSIIERSIGSSSGFRFEKLMEPEERNDK